MAFVPRLVVHSYIRTILPMFTWASITVFVLLGCSGQAGQTNGQSLDEQENTQAQKNPAQGTDSLAATAKPAKDGALSTAKPTAKIAAGQNPNSKPRNYSVIEWTDLLPDADLHALENPPEYIDDIADGSEQDQLSSQLKAEAPKLSDNPAEARYQQALVSKTIRPEFDGRAVKIPGFIVPLIFDDNQTITTFFLVPFFGACLHMPPPPPNQILYAEYEPGTRVNALYDPFWISGTLSTTLIENDLATAAYSIVVDKVEPYTDYVDLPEFNDDEEQGSAQDWE